MKRLIVILVSLLVISINCGNGNKSSSLKGPYLGQSPPGMVPELFAPGIISTGHHESAIFFSPDGNEIYYNIMHITHQYTAIVFRRLVDNTWSDPEVTSFSGKYLDADACISFDGKRLYFTSNRPSGDKKDAGNLDIWFVDRIESGWSKPQNIGAPVNTRAIEVNPCLTRDGTLYFASLREDGNGSYDIYKSALANGKYTEPENLGDSINTESFESSPFVNPDENYLIFNVFAGKNSKRKSGLHISFKKEDGTWAKAVNMGNLINEIKPSMFACVSFDNRYLFYTSDKVPYLPYNDAEKDYGEIIRMFNSPQNGTGDIYWVDAGIIEEIRQKVLK